VVAAHRVVMDTIRVRLGVTWGPAFLISGTIPQAYLLLMSFKVPSAIKNSSPAPSLVFPSEANRETKESTFSTVEDFAQCW